MAHVTAKGDPTKEAVLDVCVRGYDSVQKKLEGNPGPNTTKIMDYIGKVRQLKALQPSKANKGVWNLEEAVHLIGELSFDIDHLPTEQLKEAAVWEVSQNSSILYLTLPFQAGLKRLPLKRLLDHLKALARRDFLSDPNSGVFQVGLTAENCLLYKYLSSMILQGCSEKPQSWGQSWQAGPGSEEQ